MNKYIKYLIVTACVEDRVEWEEEVDRSSLDNCSGEFEWNSKMFHILAPLIFKSQISLFIERSSYGLQVTKF